MCFQENVTGTLVHIHVGDENTGTPPRPGVWTKWTGPTENRHVVCHGARPESLERSSRQGNLQPSDGRTEPKSDDPKVDNAPARSTRFEIGGIGGPHPPLIKVVTWTG